jgi:hypothetical protein
MASPRAVAIKTASAVATIEQASAALAAKFGVELEPMPNITRYPSDFGRAVQLEYLGNVLKSLALGSKAAKVADFEAPEEEVAEEVAEVPEEAEEDLKPKSKKKK